MKNSEPTLRTPIHHVLGQYGSLSCEADSAKCLEEFVPGASRRTGMLGPAAPHSRHVRWSYLCIAAAALLISTFGCSPLRGDSHPTVTTEELEPYARRVAATADEEWARMSADSPTPEEIESFLQKYGKLRVWAGGEPFLIVPSSVKDAENQLTENLLLQDARDADRLHSIGLAHWEAGRPKRAIPFLTEAIRLGGTDHFTLAYAYSDTGDQASALEQWTRSLERQSSTYHWTWNNRGNSLRFMGRYEEALVDYECRAEHCWNGDHERPNALSRLRYHQMYVPRILERIAESAPEGADVTSWRY